MGCCGRGIHRVTKYLAARKQWVTAGKPTRSKEEMSNIFENFCKPCDRFTRRKNGTGVCTECDCNLSTEPYQVNKLWMTTEKCPLEKW